MLTKGQDQLVGTFHQEAAVSLLPIQVEGKVLIM